MFDVFIAVVVKVAAATTALVVVVELSTDPSVEIEEKDKGNDFIKGDNSKYNAFNYNIWSLFIK